MANRVNAMKLYHRREYPITDKITLRIPLVEDLQENEDLFWFVLYTFIGNTTMRRLALWKMEPRIDWNKVSNYELFCKTVTSLPVQATRMFFGDLDFTSFDLYEIQGVELDKVEDIPLAEGQKKPTFTQKRNLRFNNWDKSHTLYSESLGIDISAGVYYYLRDVMREMVHIYPKDEYARGKTTKQLIIEQEENKLERESKQSADRLTQSNIQPMISSCVCNANYPYNIQESYELTITQFMDCCQRLRIVESSRALLRSSYIGLIDASKLPASALDFSRPIYSKK